MTAAAALAVMMMLAGVDPAIEQCVARNDPLGQSVRKCVELEARKLEPSGETPTDIATAAMSACLGETNAYLDGIGACSNDAFKDSMGRSMDKVGRDRVIQIVVEIRASLRRAKLGQSQP